MQSDPKHPHQQCLPIEIVEVEACPDGEELRHATVVGSVRHPSAAAPTTPSAAAVSQNNADQEAVVMRRQRRQSGERSVHIFLDYNSLLSNL